MLKILRIRTTYPPPEEDESDYCPDGEADVIEEEVSFRELVELMEEHGAVSCSPCTGDTFEWCSWPDAEQNYRTGEWTEQSIHYARENPARHAKYWRKAMQFAGLIKRKELTI